MLKTCRRSIFHRIKMMNASSGSKCMSKSSGLVAAIREPSTKTKKTQRLSHKKLTLLSCPNLPYFFWGLAQIKTDCAPSLHAVFDRVAWAFILMVVHKHLRPPSASPKVQNCASPPTASRDLLLLLGHIQPWTLPKSRRSRIQNQSKDYRPWKMWNVRLVNRNWKTKFGN